MGKTSTSMSLASGLARRGRHVRLVDIDSQANSTKALIPDYLDLRKENTVYTIIVERHRLPIQHTTILYHVFIRSHFTFGGTDVDLRRAKDHREEPLRSMVL